MTLNKYNIELDNIDYYFITHNHTDHIKMLCKVPNSKIYSYIPSSFLEGKMIPTQFFFSVFIEGTFEIIDNIEKRKELLYEIVKKYEPDNNTLSINDDIFNYSQKNMLIGVLKAENITAKAKFGQNIPDNDINIIINDLKNRGTKTDNETIAMINKMRK